MNNKPKNLQIHSIPPFVFPDSRVLVLGSFPSVKSRESAFFYGHPQNRFWQVMAAVHQDEVPGSVPEKKAFMRKHRIAVWDVIQSCKITGSSDASIRDALVNPVAAIIPGTRIRKVLINGRLAGSLYARHLEQMPDLPYQILPSTSAANAACSLDNLIQAWSVILAD